MRGTRVLLATALLLGGACSGDGDEGSATTTTAEASSTSTTVPEGLGYEAVVEALSDDAMEGRDNQTAGSELAQEYLIEQLSEFADPFRDDYRQPFEQGTNIVALIPGNELPNEYVILGAHYDHLGRSCPTAVPGDDICNGAGDNAAGVAAVLEIGRRIATGEPPRRSVVLAFWDAEEDGLLGARAYTAAPLVPLDATTAYLNWDIQGVNLLPSLAKTTVVVGAETGGPALVDAARAAVGGSELEAVQLSLLFGQGRSDHAPFAAAGVPTAFFTDANNGCYHTAQDELGRLDPDKLGMQIDIGEALTRDLVTTDAQLSFVADAPVASYGDAESMLAVVSRAEPDFDLFSADDQAMARQFLTDLQAMVDGGPEAFDDDDIAVLLGGSAAVVELLADGECTVPAG